MNYLCDPLDVVKALGISQAQQITAENAKPAISVATRALSTALDTGFEYTTQTDYFNAPYYNSSSHIFARLLLKDRFLDPDVSVVVRYSATGLPLVTSGAGEVLDQSYYTVDTNVGVITIIYPNPYTGAYGGPSAFSVTYSSGFTENPSSPGMLIDVPTWLYDSAVALSVYALKTMPLNTSQRQTNKGQRVGASEKETLLYATMLYSAHVRPRAGMLFPVMTVVV